MERGGETRGEFTVDKPGRHGSASGEKSASALGSRVGSVRDAVLEVAPYLCGPPPGSAEKSTGKSAQRAILETAWPVLLNTKVIEDTASVRNCLSPEEPKETRQPDVRWGPGWDPGTGENLR